MAEAGPFVHAKPATAQSPLQRAVYDAERAAGLPGSGRGRELLTLQATSVPVPRCAVYLRSVQQQAWFCAAFAGHSAPVVVIGGRGTSYADPARRLIKVGDDDRLTTRDCERACLHELAHIVTAERGPDGVVREPRAGAESSQGHHHAWRANFVLIVQMMMGGQAASRLRIEFREWGLLMR